MKQSICLGDLPKHIVEVEGVVDLTRLAASLDAAEVVAQEGLHITLPIITNTKVPETIYIDWKTLYPRRIYQRSEYSQLTSELYNACSANNAIQTNDNSSTINSCQMSSTMTEVKDMLKARSVNSDYGENIRSSGNGESVAPKFRK